MLYHPTEAKPNQSGGFDAVCTRCGSKFAIPLLQKSVEIDAPKEKVYTQGVDYRQWPKLNPEVLSVELIAESVNEQHIAAVFRRKNGKLWKTTITHRVVSSERIEEEQPLRWNANVLLVETYERSGEGTRFTLALGVYHPHLGVVGRHLIPVLRPRVERAIRKALESNVERRKRAAETFQP